jgi:hypothetical protein
LALGAERAIPRGAEARDESDVGAGLGVVDEDRVAVHLEDVGSLGPVLGQGLVVVQPVHEGRLFARDVAPRRRLKFELDPAQPATSSLVDRPVDVGDDAVVVACDAHHHPSRPDDRGEDLRTIEHQMGVRAQEQRVFVRGGFALHSVDDDALVVSALAPYESGLARGGERRAAATSNPRGVELVEQ